MSSADRFEFKFLITEEQRTELIDAFGGTQSRKLRVRVYGTADDSIPPTSFVEIKQQVVEVDAYLRYLALENILCHWDGYSFSPNNYRIYENPETGRFHFVLHGMDQTFGDAGQRQSVWREPVAAVGAILWRSPAMRQRYNAQLFDVYEKVLKPVDWAARVEGVGNRLMQALSAVDAQRAKDYQGRLAEARDHVSNRLNNVRQQVEAAQLAAKPFSARDGELAGRNWTARAEQARAEEPEIAGQRFLYLKAEGQSSGSWRTVVTLPAGRYRFEARVRVKGVVGITIDSGEGAGVRISGASRRNGNHLVGDSPAQLLGFEFESQGTEQTLVLELRASAGEMWAERESLKIVQLP